MADDSVPAELADLQLYSSRTVRRILGVSRRTLSKWIAAKILPEPVLLSGPGGLHYWRASAIRSWLDERFGAGKLDRAVA